jgi:hypothetical protein
VAAKEMKLAVLLDTEASADARMHGSLKHGKHLKRGAADMSWIVK